MSRTASSAWRRAHAHRGALTAVNLGTGARFEMRLPLIDAY
ncbi:hypothetical protein [Nocardia sp. NPDC058497]